MQTEKYNENLQVVNQNSTNDNPFATKRSEHIMHGAVQIEESRAIAEAQGKLVIAKKFPRDEAAAFEQVIRSCSRMGLANVSMYAYPRGGKTITGPSIRFAEELARAWGNIDFGIRELSQQPGMSEMEAYCWDLQTNTFSSFKFTVKHERHTTTGIKQLIDPRDIYELCANQGARRLRARILAVLPPDLVESAIDQCKRTLAGLSTEPIQDRVKKMILAFNAFGVTKSHIEEYIGIKVDAILPEKLVELLAIYNSIKEGSHPASEWFGKDAKATPEPIAGLNAQLKPEQPTVPEVPTANTTKEEPPKDNKPKGTRKKNDSPEVVSKPEIKTTTANTVNQSETIKQPEPPTSTNTNKPPESPVTETARFELNIGEEQPGKDDEELAPALFPDDNLL